MPKRKIADFLPLVDRVKKNDAEKDAFLSDLIIIKCLPLCLLTSDQLILTGSYTTGVGEAVALMGNDGNLYKDSSNENTFVKDTINYFALTRKNK